MKDLAARIEHTLLKAQSTGDDIRRLCAEAVEHGFYSVCVNPVHVRLARGLLLGHAPRVTTVVGFPLGASLSETKIFEAVRASDSGAHEIDMVVDLAAAGEGRWEDVREEISAVVLATPGLVHKVIIECCYLTDQQKRLAAQAVLLAGAQYVKTSTGFGPSGATVHDVLLLKDAVSGRARVKAAGGIKTGEAALGMVRAGADLLGTSSGVAIVGGVKQV